MSGLSRLSSETYTKLLASECVLVSFFGTKLLCGLVSLLCVFPTVSHAQFAGVYTDKPSYAAGDTISIHASAPVGESATVLFRLLRLGDESKEYGRTKPATIKPVATNIGSFLEVPSLSLAGRKTLTIEGWWYPTLVGTDMIRKWPLITSLGPFEQEIGLALVYVMRPNWARCWEV